MATTRQEALTQYWERIHDQPRWPNRCTLTCPPQLRFMDIYREFYRAFAPDKPALPTKQESGLYGDFGSAMVDEAYLGPAGDGIVVLTALRGFMPGVGQTLTYIVLVGDQVWVEVEDYWEDNIADPTEAEFKFAAGSAGDLERALRIFVERLAAAGITPMR